MTLLILMFGFFNIFYSGIIVIYEDYNNDNKKCTLKIQLCYPFLVHNIFICENSLSKYG